VLGVQFQQLSGIEAAESGGGGSIQWWPLATPHSSDYWCVVKLQKPKTPTNNGKSHRKWCSNDPTSTNEKLYKIIAAPSGDQSNL